MQYSAATLSDIFAPNPGEFDRLRALPAWQATATCFGLAILLVPLLLLPWWLVDRMAVHDPVTRTILAGMIGAALAILTFRGVTALFGVPPRAIFLGRPTVRTLHWTAVGMFLGLVLAVLTVLSTDGVVTVTLNGATGRLLAGAAIGLWTGTVEELFLRGAVLSIVGHQWNWPGAVVLTALLFGAMHNAHADTVVGTGLYVALTATAGLLLAMIVLVTRNIWNAVAVHASWNTLFSEHVLSFDSGGDVSALIRYEFQPARWFLGGRHVEPTASPTALGLFVLAVGVYIFLRARRRPTDSHSQTSQA